MNGGSPLVDTSVLIDYLTGIKCREAEILDELLQPTPPASPVELTPVLPDGS
jgi:hypothetical protein